MSRTDHDRPWRIREADQPELPWTQILNTCTKWRGARTSKRAKMRRFWKGERFLAREAIRNGDEAPTRQNPYRVRADLW